MNIVNSVFPVYKPKNVYTRQLLRWIQLTLDFEKQFQDKKCKKIHFKATDFTIKPRIEPIFAGVSICGTGIAAKYCKLHLYWNCHHMIKCKLGIMTDSNSIDGTIIGQKSFDHITLQLLESVCKSLIGDVELQNPKWFWGRHYDWDGEADTLIPLSLFTCHDCQLIHFSPPHFTIKTITTNGLPIRSFVNELGHRLHSYASIEECEMFKFGPLTVEDCLKSYELHFNYISNACNKYNKICVTELMKFSHLKPDLLKSHKIK